MISFFLSKGGGSALLPLPCPPITLEEEAALTKTLSQNGATINDMNTIRKHIEELKGGGLAKAAFPAQVRSEWMAYSKTWIGLTDETWPRLYLVSCGLKIQCFGV